VCVCGGGGRTTLIHGKKHRARRQIHKIYLSVYRRKIRKIFVVMFFHSVISRLPTFWDVKLRRWLRGCDVSKQLNYVFHAAESFRRS